MATKKKKATTLAAHKKAVKKTLPKKAAKVRGPKIEIEGTLPKGDPRIVKWTDPVRTYVYRAGYNHPIDGNRGYSASNGEFQIRAGCRLWLSFSAALNHYVHRPVDGPTIRAGLLAMQAECNRLGWKV